MDDIKREDLESLEASTEQSEALESEEITVPEVEEQTAEAVEDVSDTASEQEVQDSTFAAEHVESEKALEEFLESSAAETETDSENTEGEMSLAKYAADCEMCATKVYFELDDLDENGNLLCPNCNEVIEIDNDAIDYYLVEKKDETPVSNYVVDCQGCEAVVHFTEDEIDDEENIVCPQCGEKIHIETEVLDAYKEVDIEKSLKKKRVLKKVFASLTGVILALALCVAVLFVAGNKSVIKIDGTSVPMNIYKCVYYCENAANYQSSGLDITKKPSSQEYSGEEFDNWDQLLRKSTEESLKIYYSIYNAGQKENFKLSDAENEEIDSTIKNINTYAENANQSFDEYMKSSYGLKISEKDFRAYLEMSQYVNSYYKSVMAKDITDEQLEKIYKQSPDSFDVVTFRYYYVQIDDSTKIDDAKKQVEAIAAAKSEKQFHELVKKYVSKDRADTYKDEESTLVKDMACANIQDRPVADVLTNAKSKPGTTVSGVSKDETFAEVAMLVEARHKSDKLIKDQAINEVASQKGQKFINDISDKAVIKASIGSILRKLEF